MIYILHMSIPLNNLTYQPCINVQSQTHYFFSMCGTRISFKDLKLAIPHYIRQVGCKTWKGSSSYVKMDERYAHICNISLSPCATYRKKGKVSKWVWLVDVHDTLNLYNMIGWNTMNLDNIMCMVMDGLWIWTCLQQMWINYEQAEWCATIVMLIFICYLP